jgi:hypothetical protein
MNRTNTTKKADGASAESARLKQQQRAFMKRRESFNIPAEHVGTLLEECLSEFELMPSFFDLNYAKDEKKLNGF